MIATTARGESVISAISFGPRASPKQHFGKGGLDYDPVWPRVTGVYNSQIICSRSQSLSESSSHSIQSGSSTIQVYTKHKTQIKMSKEIISNSEFPLKPHNSMSKLSSWIARDFRVLTTSQVQLSRYLVWSFAVDRSEWARSKPLRYFRPSPKEKNRRELTIYSLSHWGI